MDKTVLVIGAGLSGMMAAYAAQREGAEVVLISRGAIGVSTNSALSNGVFSGPASSYTEEAYIKDTVDIGRMLNHRPLVQVVAKGASSSFSLLHTLGLRLEEAPNFYHAAKPPRSEIIPGFALVRRLTEVLKGLDRVRPLTGFYVTKLLKKEGKICGVRGLNRQGKDSSIYAPVVVLAAGGAGAIYRNNDNQKSTMGQGYYLAAQAGLKLWDMEFVQFIPIVLAQPHLPSVILFSPYPEGTRVINEAGEDLIGKFGIGNLNDVVRTKRDYLSIMLFKESAAGPVFIDYRKVSPEAWDTHPLALLKKLKFDFRNKPVIISPAAHFIMGGIRIDETCQTSVPGLFACGEVVWGVHGANRRGGNALTECAVLGELAGRNAAEYALMSTDGFTIKEGKGGSLSDKSLSSNRYRQLRVDIRTVAWEKAGIVRSETGLRDGLFKIAMIASRIRRMEPQDVFQEILHNDLMGACLVVKAILTASLARTESRGSFCRSDFPTEDNNNWLRNSCLDYDPLGDTFSLTHHSTWGS